MPTMNSTWMPKRGMEPTCEGCGLLLTDSNDWYCVREPSGPQYYLCVDCMATFAPNPEPGTTFDRH